MHLSFISSDKQKVLKKYAEFELAICESQFADRICFSWITLSIFSKICKSKPNLQNFCLHRKHKVSVYTSSSTQLCVFKAINQYLNFVVLRYGL